MSGLEAHLRLSCPLPLDVELHVAPGEILALIGRSGAGKSTVLKALAGLIPADGSVRVGGKDWSGRPAHARETGFLFQSYALFPHRTSLQNLLMAMPTPDEAEARDLLAAVHLSGLESRRPHQLSGGQQQRVALARALARKPRLLLLDEPFSAVDRPTRRALAGTIGELRTRLAMPILLVSHDIADIAPLADRIAVLQNGRITQVGSTAEVIAHPASASVAELVGS
ncbi:MAG: ABC transporter [Sphingomonas sp.]|nr:MAG: ABC transporter [Sphingomonas sp.]